MLSIFSLIWFYKLSLPSAAWLNSYRTWYTNLDNNIVPSPDCWSGSFLRYDLPQEVSIQILMPMCLYDGELRCKEKNEEGSKCFAPSYDLSISWRYVKVKRSLSKQIKWITHKQTVKSSSWLTPSSSHPQLAWKDLSVAFGVRMVIQRPDFYALIDGELEDGRIVQGCGDGNFNTAKSGEEYSNTYEGKHVATA